MERRSVLDIPIFHKLYALYTIIQSSYYVIPKNQRYTLWQRCDSIVLDILEIVISIGHQIGDQRLTSLYLVSTKLDLLKVLMRLAKDLKAIDKKKYISWQGLCQDIGKMLGGWIKSVSH